MNMFRGSFTLKKAKVFMHKNVKYIFHDRCFHKITAASKSDKLSSKEIRQLFLDFFIKEKNHTYVHSSPVFLNNDPTLLFVNAGMNQFRSLFLNKIQPEHPFSKLKRVANSQKCIRLSGKHNDLEDVGQDLHHHTFFEMLGNWSFGDYSKNEACEMAWELLTKVYNLNPDNLYVTYFGGSEILNVPPDEDCKNIWLNIGVNSSHIFPFGRKENFWEMGNVGPCGPCTEIHYDFLSLGPDSAAKRINADQPDLIEIWNLVFIQYNHEQSGILKILPSFNVDTGMGFERLTAVLQGTMSNYDTDIFLPIFKAIEKNFNLPPYGGKTGFCDKNGLDSAYRILADHSRMFSVAISDGLFPDNYDAGHILRKIIRRSSYTANKVMKGRPGVLSSLVPVVAESLDFFPEIKKNVKEIVEIINEEEKLFHQLINRGRKMRNKMLSESKSNIFSGYQIWQLKEHYGLEEMVLKDLASEVNVTLDWEEYENVSKEKKEAERNHFKEKSDIFSAIAKNLQDKGIESSNDSFKYNYSTEKNSYGVENIISSIVGIVINKNLVLEASAGNKCLIVTDKTNYYSEAGGQIADIGKISNKDFTFKVDNVFASKGYVFHKGTILNGTVKTGFTAELCVDRDHRLACSQNHTATHLLNSILRDFLPYTSQRTSYVGPSNLRFGFIAKSALTQEQIENIENTINKIIKKNLDVNKTEMLFEDLLSNTKAIVLRGEDYPETVSVITIGSNTEGDILSVEPCCGTHVHNTFDVDQFLFIPAKSHGGSIKILSAVTGHKAHLYQANGMALSKRVLQLKNKVDGLTKVSEDTLTSLLKEVKQVLKDCQQQQDAPLLTLEKCAKVVLQLKLQLSDMLSSCSINENMSSDLSNVFGPIKPKISANTIQLLQDKNLNFTHDDHKYDWNISGLNCIEAKILAVIRNNQLVNNVQRGLNCQLILNKTNFYAEDDDQASDIGTIHCEDFVFKVNNVYKMSGFVLHDGYVEEGILQTEKLVKAILNDDHRLSCCQNHTALHLLNAALRQELPYAYQLYAHTRSKDFTLLVSSKIAISDSHIERIEKKVNEAVNNKLPVIRSKVPIVSLQDFPTYKLPVVKKSKDFVSIITIGKDSDESVLKSLEPCLGTHVSNTSDIGEFIIVTSKSKSNNERLLRSVTGKTAEIVKNDGVAYDKYMLQLEEYVLSCLDKNRKDYLELWDCLKEIKKAKFYYETDLPLLLFRKHQNILSELSKELTKATNEFIQQGFKNISSEIKSILSENADKPYIVHNLHSLGDGKKIINFALENSKDKPAMYFAQDGYKSLICSCSVPKHLVQSSFSALIWIDPVASLLEGRARTLAKDPELLYSIVCSNTKNLDKAINIAKEFIESHLKLNES